VGTRKFLAYGRLRRNEAVFDIVPETNMAKVSSWRGAA
jgi:hypothetical protein